MWHEFDFNSEVPQWISVGILWIIGGPSRMWLQFYTNSSRLDLSCAISTGLFSRATKMQIYMQTLNSYIHDRSQHMHALYCRIAIKIIVLFCNSEFNSMKEKEKCNFSHQELMAEFPSTWDNEEGYWRGWMDTFILSFSLPKFRLCD